MSEPDQGQSDAINKGFSLATGRILGWLNGDDILLPYALNIVRNFSIANNHPDLMIGDAYMVEKDFRPIRHFQFNHDKVRFSTLLDYASNHLVQPSVFFSRAAWQNCGPLDITDHFAMDADLFLCMAKEYEPTCIQQDISYSVYHEECKTQGKRAESITQLALVQAKHGGMTEARKTLDLLVEMYNSAQRPSDHRKSGLALKDQSTMHRPTLINHAEPTVATNLRIALIATTLTGGAGIACRRQYDALNKAGINVEMFTLFDRNIKGSRLIPVKNTSNNPFPSSRESILNEAWQKIAITPQSKDTFYNGYEMFSTTYSVVDWDETVKLLQNFDIVHFHWTPGIVDFNAFEQKPFSKPVFWTLHDMNLFTGGCHYSQGCEEFISGCEFCHLFDRQEGLPAATFHTKLNGLAGFTSITVLCPSEWIAIKARKSPILSSHNIMVIDNFIGQPNLPPMEKYKARRQLGLPIMKHLILIGAESLDNSRKGAELIGPLLSRLHQRKKYNCVLVTFGKGSISSEVETYNMGFVSDEYIKATLYSACDVFCLLSLEENAPQTAIESLLAGCPITSFNIGNLSELVHHHEDGYIASLDNVDDFADGVCWTLNNVTSPSQRIRIAQRTRRRFNNNNTLGQLIKLYESEKVKFVGTAHLDNNTPASHLG
jgi:glycosyltransferase involved in cell wall biosynthesis